MKKKKRPEETAADKPECKADAADGADGEYATDGNATDGNADKAADGDPAESAASANEEKLNGAIAELKDKLAQAESAGRDYQDRWLRSAAEFDNYKRRTANEMDRLYTSSAAEVIAMFLPIVDSIERAANADKNAAAAGADSGADSGTDSGTDAGGPAETGADACKPVEACAGSGTQDPYKEGLILIERQLREVLKKLDVKPIPGAGAQFDPKFHEAVMHVKDETLGANVIAEVFQQGYMFRDRVVRYGVVKVAN